MQWCTSKGGLHSSLLPSPVVQPATKKTTKHLKGTIACNSSNGCRSRENIFALCRVGTIGAKGMLTQAEEELCSPVKRLHLDDAGKENAQQNCKRDGRMEHKSCKGYDRERRTQGIRTYNHHGNQTALVPTSTCSQRALDPWACSSRGTMASQGSCNTGLVQQQLLARLNRRHLDPPQSKCTQRPFYIYDDQIGQRFNPQVRARSAILPRLEESSLNQAPSSIRVGGFKSSGKRNPMCP